MKLLHEELSRDLDGLFLLHGTLGRKRNRESVEALRAFPEGRHVVVLDTLQQYAGRLHRRSDRKREVVVYDYVDARVGVLERMYRRRLQGYAGIGYTIGEG